MNAATEWARAYFAQAKSDWAAYQVLNATTLPACHSLHALQMALEKLGKALLMDDGSLKPVDRKASHLAFAKYLQTAPYDRSLARSFGMRTAQFRAYCGRARQIARNIEGLQPQLAGDGPNTEYPWPAPDGSIKTPSMTNLPQARLLLTPRGSNLLKFIDGCFRYHARALGCP